LKLPRGLFLEVIVVVLADLLITYLTVEALAAFTGGAHGLFISTFLIQRLGLSDLLAGAALSLAVAGVSAGLAVWLWRYKPMIVTRYLSPSRRTAEGIRGRAAAEAQPVFGPGGAMRAGDLKLAENVETQPFVDVVQLEGFPLNIYAAVTKEEGREGYTYVVIEPSLSEAEKAKLAELKKLLVDELDVDLRSVGSTQKAEAYISSKVKQLARKYGFKISQPTMTKLLYYLTRDFIHLGKIEPLMRDKLIEDISCDGAGIPIYIWYRDYESIPTNIKFDTDEELDTFVSKLAYSAGKHVSLAEPIVDASLADGSRLHLTYGKEITQKGSTFTIRKFRTDPLTIVDLIRYNTMSSDVAAYLWYIIEKKLALLVAGGTASGKTTTLNALSMFIEPGEKIVSIEDTPELNLPHENWIQSVTRGVGTAGEITMFDLVKASLRQRPDVLIVGEVRGEEAFTMLQSVATGHGGLGTIHADSVEACINRLTTEPMNIPRSLIGTTLDCIVMQLKIRLADRSVRRVVAVTEVVGHDSRTDQILLNEAFRWDPVVDKFQFTGRSKLFDKITAKFGTRPEEIRRDIDGRKTFLDWLVAKNVRSHSEVSEQVREFYAGPYAVINKAKVELEGLKA